MRSPLVTLPALTLILWTSPQARRTIHAIAGQGGWRRMVDVDDELGFSRAVGAANPGIALIDEHGCRTDPFDLMARAAAGTFGHLLPPFILMVSEPTRLVVETALAAGFGSVIAKPFSAQTLNAHIARAIAAGGPPVLRDDQLFLD